MRIHRATLINKTHIQTIEHWFNYTYQLTMTNQLKFQVSRSYMKPFKQDMDYLDFQVLIYAFRVNV